MNDKKAHRVRTSPRMSVRDLADYMAASELAKRTIVREAKFQPIARVVQHDEARSTVSKFIRNGDADIDWLIEEADRLRNKMADSAFDRDVLDYNADYIQRFAEVWPSMDEIPGIPSAPGGAPPIDINGLRITVDLHVRLRRLTKQNKVKSGGIMLRYAKKQCVIGYCG